ncbi:hypothetical protein [Flavobacterium ajazii]|uniref:hypothetical protein n=1 Tax=Flavobacterium ajazii TaxID=2692318 RepID=UPI0013D1BBEC|nr:hypothetical protein [Flavobacterium ajazii]
MDYYQQKIFTKDNQTVAAKYGAGSNGRTLADNRNSLTIQRKQVLDNCQPSVPLKPIIIKGQQVLQRVSRLQALTSMRSGNSKDRAKAIRRIKRINLLGIRNSNQSRNARRMFGKNGVVDAKKFNRYFHGHKAMDEMMSTATTLAHAHTLYKKGKFKAAKDLIRLSDRARFPTSHMGHYVPGSRFQHPTSANTQTYGRRGLAHGSFDRERAKLVLGIKKPVKALKTAIAYSMNNGAQPPYAKNSLKKFTTPAEIEEADKVHNLREDFKDYVRGRRGPEVPADDEWNPGKYRGRSVSPARTRK